MAFGVGPALMNMISSALYVSGNVVSVWGLETIPVVQLLCCRWALMGIVVLAHATFTGELGKMHLLGEHGSKRLLLVLSCLRGFDSMLWLSGLNFVSISAANSIVYSSPIMATIGGHFALGGAERLTLSSLACVLVAFAGVLLIVHPWSLAADEQGHSIMQQLLGVAMELGCAACNATNQILCRKHQQLSSISVIGAFIVHAQLGAAFVMMVLTFSGCVRCSGLTAACSTSMVPQLRRHRTLTGPVRPHVLEAAVCCMRASL
jgi:drug/metabolite transporter (DMT)-like permease